MCTNDSSSGRKRKISLPMCLPSNKRSWRDASSFGTRQNTTAEHGCLLSHCCWVGCFVWPALRADCDGAESRLGSRGLCWPHCAHRLGEGACVFCHNSEGQD